MAVRHIASDRATCSLTGGLMLSWGLVAWMALPIVPAWGQSLSDPTVEAAAEELCRNEAQYVVETATKSDPAVAQDAANEAPNFLAQLADRLLHLPSRYERRLDAPLDETAVITNEDTSLCAATVPSLWWRRDQLPSHWLNPVAAPGAIQIIEGYRLVQGWTAFRSPSVDAYIVDIQVDPQYWNRLSYPQQYAVTTQLGLAGMSHGYQMRIYRSIDLVGLYACDFNAIRQLPGPALPLADLENVECTASVGNLFLERDRAAVTNADPTD